MIEHFLTFCRENLEQSFSQKFQDLFGLWAAGGRTDGYFVEFGALNGRDFSNSYMLEKYGWSGIISEPHPDYKQRMHEVRRCHISTLCVYDQMGRCCPVPDRQRAPCHVGHWCNPTR